MIDSHVRHQVSDLDAKVVVNTAEAQESLSKAQEQQSQADAIYSTMNFRERNLGGWFGGDKDKVSRYQKFLSLAETFNAEAQGFAMKAKEFDSQVEEVLDDHLQKTDPVYNGLLQPRNASTEMKAAIDAFLKKIDTALSEVDEAQGMETLDLVTSNKGIAFLSYLENSEASDAIDKVKSAAKPFQDAVQAYNGLLKDFEVPQIEAGLGDGIDLVFDMAFDGFDFTSIFTLSSLGTAESELKEARTKIEKVKAIVDGHFAQADKAVSGYIQQARLQCRAV